MKRLLTVLLIGVLLVSFALGAQAQGPRLGAAIAVLQAPSSEAGPPLIGGVNTPGEGLDEEGLAWAELHGVAEDGADLVLYVQVPGDDRFVFFGSLQADECGHWHFLYPFTVADFYTFRIYNRLEAGHPTRFGELRILLDPEIALTTYLLQQGNEGYEGAEDTWIGAWEPDEPHGDTTNLQVRYGEERSALLRFDLPEEVLAATIEHATFTMYASERSNVNPLGIRMLNMRRAWSEAEATYMMADAETPWEVPGANGPNDREMGRDPSEALLRVAHLSPDAPAVDIWVGGEVVLSGVSFGTVSDYLGLPGGIYEVAVTPAGAGLESAVITAEVELLADAEYTAAALGFLDEIQLNLYTDSMKPAKPGTANVRVIHASPDAPAVDLVVRDTGQVLFTDVTFGEATIYIPVGHGVYDLDVRLAGTETTVLALDDVPLRDGLAYSLIVYGLAGGEPALTGVRVRDFGGDRTEPVYVTRDDAWYGWHATEFVQEWATDPAANYGFKMMALPDVSVQYDFLSSEHPEECRRPILWVIVSGPAAEPS